eukprot:4758625-Alexandrium_andersonii.AAC.1
MPPLELLPDPGNDAGGLVRKDVHNHLLPHPGQAVVTGLRVVVAENGIDVAEDAVLVPLVPGV